MAKAPRSLTAKVAASRTAATDHAAGWNAALDKALANASTKFDKGSHQVNVEFWAEIEVTNPGTIHNYCVTLTPHG
jgi:hypothetical protein